MFASLINYFYLIDASLSHHYKTLILVVLSLVQKCMDILTAVASVCHMKSLKA